MRRLRSCRYSRHFRQRPAPIKGVFAQKPLFTGHARGTSYGPLFGISPRGPSQQISGAARIDQSKITHPISTSGSALGLVMLWLSPLPVDMQSPACTGTSTPLSLTTPAPERM